MDANSRESIREIIALCDTKPNVPFRHIELEIDGRRINFTYKTYTNFANARNPVRHKYTLYIGTKKASEKELREMI